MPVENLVPLDGQLCFSIYATAIAINRTYKPLLDAMGVTYPQYLVLSALWEEDARTIGAIASRLALESSTITPLVKRLEAAGFVTRVRSQADERQVLVSLTPKGKRFARMLHPHIRRYNDVASDKIPASQLRALRQALDTIYRNIAGMDKSLPDFPDFADQAAASGPKRRRATLPAAKR